MADLRAEQIMAAIGTALAATSAGSRVERGQIYPHPDDATQFPAIGIYIGSDSPESFLQTNITDWELEVFIETFERVESSEYSGIAIGLETKLAELRKEVHLAIMADYTLGLSFVHDIFPGVATQPTLDGDGKVPTGSQLLSFTVKYRSSRADASE